MAVTIGKLAVDLVARTGKWRKSLGRAGKGLGAFVGRIGAGAKRVLKFAAIMTGVAAAALVFFTKKAFAAIDAEAKLARQIGISIDGLRGLKRAADITGAGEAALTKGVGFLTKALGEAKTGVGEGKQALEELGLEADTLAEMPLEQAVGLIADKMNLLATQSDKAFVASKLFGRGGLALVNTLALGSEGLEEMAAGAIKLQGSLTAVDAGKIEAANDAIVDMGTAWRAVFDRIAAATAPFVKRVADFITKFLVWFREKGQELVPQFLSWFSAIWKNTGELISRIWNGLKQIPNITAAVILEFVRIWKTGIIKIKTEWQTLQAIFSTGWEGIGTLIADMWGNVKIAFLNAISFIGNKLVGFARWLSDVLPGENEWAQNLIKGYEQGLGAVEKTVDNIERKSEQRWAKFWEKNEKARGGLTDDLGKLNTELDVLQKSLTARQAALLGGPDAQKSWLEALGGSISTVLGQIESIKLPNVVDAFETGGAAAGDNIAKSMKAFTAPGAIEKGTVEAYTANIRAAYKAVADNSKKTVDELKTNNKLQKENNRLVEAATAATETVEIA